MNNQNEILQILSPLKLYNLDSINNVTAETSVISEYLDDISTKTDNLLLRFFIENIVAYPSLDLTHLKRIFSIPTDITNKKVYDIIANRMKIDNSFFTNYKIKKMLLGYGFTATLSENFITKTLKVTITNDSSIFFDNVEKIVCIKSCLPCKGDITYTVILP